APLDVADRAGRPLERLAVRRGDHAHEPGVVAARLAADADVIRDHVRRLAGAAVVAAAEAADVRRALVAVAHHLAEPALTEDLRQGQRRHHGRRHAVLRVDAGVRRAAGDLDLPPLRADGADRQVG